MIALPTMPNVLTLTDAAADRVRALSADGDLRIGVKSAGCAGMSYTMEHAAGRNPLDEVVEDKGVTVLIDSAAVMFLLGAEMDWRADKLASGFVFKNPNQTDACGCGESVTLKAATS